MKTLKLLVFSLVFFFTFFSCVKDEDNTPSCIDFNTTSQDYSVIEAAIYTSEIIEFEITNVCPYKIKVTDIKIEGNNSNEFTVQKLPVGTYLTGKKVNFNIVFSPKSLGEKKAVLTIFHEFGSIVIHLSGTGI